MSEFCHCGCHDPDVAMMHFMPCCHTCVYCWRYVRFEAWDRHEATCYSRLTATETAFISAGETHVWRIPGFHRRDEMNWWYPVEFNLMTYTESTA